MADALTPMPTDWQRALAIVAHPDDMEYGAGAAVAHWAAAGKEITYLLVTRGEAGIDGLAPEESARVREAEQRASAAVVGVRAVEFLDHRDGVVEYGVPLRRDLAAAIRRHRPEVVIAMNYEDTWPGGHWNTPDHRAVGRAAMDAVGDAANRWIFPEQLGEGGLERWDGVRALAVFTPEGNTHYQAVDPEDVERAVASLAEHRAYVAALSDQPPAEYARDFLVPHMAGADPVTGGYAVAFRLHPC